MTLYAEIDCIQVDKTTTKEITKTSSVTKKTTTENNNIECRLCEITLEDVSQHDDIKDCWIVIFDRVYDVTSLLESHPGGQEVLLEYAGRDATIAFESTGHSRAAYALLKQYEIGVLPMHEQLYIFNEYMQISNSIIIK